MARIRCRYIGCVYLEEGICTATVVDLDPEEGCVTFAQVGDAFEDDEEWDFEEDDEELDGYDEWDDDEDDYDDSLYEDEDEF